MHKRRRPWLHQYVAGSIWEAANKGLNIQFSGNWFWFLGITNHARLLTPAHLDRTAPVSLHTAEPIELLLRARNLKRQLNGKTESSTVMLSQRQTQTTSHHAYELHSRDRTRMKAHNKIKALFPQSKQEREGMRGIESRLVKPYYTAKKIFTKDILCNLKWTPPSQHSKMGNECPITHKNRTNKHFFKRCVYCKSDWQFMVYNLFGSLI